MPIKRVEPQKAQKSCIYHLLQIVWYFRYFWQINNLHMHTEKCQWTDAGIVERNKKCQRRHNFGGSCFKYNCLLKIRGVIRGVLLSFLSLHCVLIFLFAFFLFDRVKKVKRRWQQAEKVLSASQDRCRLWLISDSWRIEICTAE